MNSTYDAGVVDEVVKADITEDRLDFLRGRANVHEIGDVEPDDVQRSFRTCFEVTQRGRLVRVATRPDNQVTRSVEQLLHELEPDAAIGAESPRRNDQCDI